MTIIKEFKAFISRGNVMDLAVAVIIGAAFGRVITSLVDDIIMPPIGKIIGDVDFTDLFISLDHKDYETLAMAKTAGAPVIAYGNFIQNIINFVIVAAAVFLMIKVLAALKKKEVPQEEVSVILTREEILLQEIRDILKSKS